MPVWLLALLAVGLSGAAPTWAQEPGAPAQAVPPALAEAPQSDATQSVTDVPPLEAVLDAVRAHSPRLRSEEATVQRYAAHLRGTRARWMDNVTVGAASTYGTYGSTLIDELSIGSQAMVMVRVSLYDVLGRRHDVRAQRAQLEEVRELANVALRNEERLATDLYHRALLAAELVAERAFAQGRLSVADLAQVAQVQAEAEAAYETARADYRNAYAQLELVAGQPLHELGPPLADRTAASDAEPLGAEPPGGARSAEAPDRP